MEKRGILKYFYLFGLVILLFSSFVLAHSLPVPGVANGLGGVKIQGLEVLDINDNEHETSGEALGLGVKLLDIIPPLWVSGDSHGHIQACSGGPLVTQEEYFSIQQADEIQVTFTQIWGVDETVQSFIDNFVPYVTGMESPASVDLPNYIMQFGIEASMFPADQFGHVVCNGISDGMFPFDASYPTPILDFCNAQPDSITGYAHVYWPKSYSLSSIPSGTTYGGTGFFASTDVANGKVDFLEAVFESQSIPQYGWQGMYYKLLNAGLRPSLTSGRDAGCVLQPFNEMMFAKISSEPPTTKKYIDAIKAGRTTVSEGKNFLNLEVAGKEIGSTVKLPSPGNVDFHVDFTTAEGQDGIIEIVIDGVIQPENYPYSLLAGETMVVDGVVNVDSSWVAAQVRGNDNQDAHTSSVYVIVDNQPICNAVDAGYWRDYSDFLTSKLDLFSFNSDQEKSEAANEIAQAKKVYEALVACDSPLPTGVSRYGTSTPACKGPIQINVKDVPTVQNSNFMITNINAPPNDNGWLVVGYAPTTSQILLKGANLAIDPDSFIVVLPVTSNSGGYSEIQVPFPSNSIGTTLYFQYFWKNTASCSSSSGISASDALAITVQ